MAVAVLTALGAEIGLATAAQSSSSATTTASSNSRVAGHGVPCPYGRESCADAAIAATGVTLAEANGAQTNARAVAKGVAARALAANAFLRRAQTASAASGNKSQVTSLLLTVPAEPNRVQQIVEGLSATAGGYSTYAGTGAAGSLGDGGAASAAQFNLKTDSSIERSGVVIAADGTVFVADTGNSTIRRIASSTSSEPGVVRSVAGRFAPTQNVELSEPLGLAIDRLGNLYIADRGGNAVLVLHNATSETPGELEIVAHVAAPSSVAVTQDGSKVFVSTTTTGAVFVIDGAGDSAKRAVAAEAGFSGRANACASSTTATSTAAAAAQASICPAALAVDPRGNLYISDANSGRLLRVNAADGKVVTIASNFRAPGAIASDANGNLYVADQGRAQIVFVPADSSQTCVTGPSGTLQLCPASNDFGSIVQGGTTASIPFVLTNTTASNVAGLTYSPALPSTSPPVQPPSSPFIVQNTSCLTSLAANLSCTLAVTFSPNTTGSISGTLSVSDSNPQDTVNSALTGTGTNFQLQLATNQSQSITVVAGQTATYNFTLVPDANNPYTGTVAIACPANLPVLAYCVLPSSPVTLSAGQNANFAVSIETTSRAGITSTAHLLPVSWLGNQRNWPGGSPRLGDLDAASRPRHGENFNAAGAALAVLAALGFFCTLVLARRRNWRVVYAAVVLASIGAVIAGCGHGKGLTVDGTPAGTTNLVIQASAQGTARSFTVQLIVQ